MITNESKNVEFGEKSILPFSFKKQSEENTNADPLIKSEGKNFRRSEVIKEDENSNDYDDLELTFKTDKKDNLDLKWERIKNKKKKKYNYCDSYVINLSVHENVHKGIK